jgi:hypothetical protein
MTGTSAASPSVVVPGDGDGGINVAKALFGAASPQRRADDQKRSA